MRALPAFTQALLTLPMLYAGEGYSTLEATIHQKTAAGYDPAALDYFYRYAYEEVGQETFCSFYEGDITAAVIDWRENPSDNQGLVFKPGKRLHGIFAYGSAEIYLDFGELYSPAGHQQLGFLYHAGAGWNCRRDGE